MVKAGAEDKWKGKGQGQGLSPDEVEELQRLETKLLFSASHLSNPYNTERAMLGSLPKMRPISVTPTRFVRPPPLCHSTRTPRGSPQHDCKQMTYEKRTKRQVF